MTALNDLSRPGVAFISNSYPPYRVHVHRRIVRELPEIRFWSLSTHDANESTRWKDPIPDEINPVPFGTGQSTADQASPRNAIGEWRKAGAIIRWLREHHIRAVALLGYNDLGRVRIIRWCRANAVPCFIAGDSNIRIDRTTGAKAWVKRRVLSALLDRCAGVLPSGSAGEAYFRRYGVPPGRIFLYPLEPDYRQISEISQQQIDEAARQFGLQPNRRRLVFSGRFVAWKRGDLLIAAFARIASERPEWDLLMIGDGSMRQAWQSVLPSSLKDRVIWTGHLAEQATVSALYRASDVLVLPSEGEPWALVINEAAAAGLAIVSSSDPGAAVELVRDGVNGRIFPPGDTDALVQCLLDVTDRDQIGRMKAASSQVLA
ncbi:MAG TPA: glycosyltransferase family 4 protein, partial [Tepidisphaeraceae bacterium]|nr:glycosyltransferase family 4 protein [Tepidisphaeraceae bacterium]